MGVVSFRLSEAMESQLRAAGISPGALAKELVEAEARRLDVNAQMRALEAFSRKPSKPLMEIIREIREEH